MKLQSLDDYLVVLDRLFQKAKAAGAVCLKTTLAYQRTLAVRKRAQGPRRESVRAPARPSFPAAEIKDFEDFIMWRLVELSAPGTSCRFRSTLATGGFRARTR